MTVTVVLMRDEAEQLYDAAVYKMRRETLRSHLWEAARALRLACGMHHTSSDPEGDAIDALDADIESEADPHV